MLVVRLLASYQDRNRIRDYLENQGSTLLDCKWAPFGRGWFGTKSERLYEITYTDSESNQHAATCKTSMLSGVYFTEDMVNGSDFRPRHPAQPYDSAEVIRLRKEVADLKQKLNDQNPPPS